MNNQFESNLRNANSEIIKMITAFGLKYDINHNLEQNIQDQKSFLNFKVYDPTPNQQTALRKLGHQFDAEWTIEGKVPESQRINTVLIEVDFTPASAKIIRDEKARIAEMKLTIEGKLNEFGLKAKFEEHLSFVRGIGSSTVVCHLWDASPEQAETLRKMANDFSYGRSKEKLPANGMQIYQFSIVNKYTYQMMQKAWSELQKIEDSYAEYPKIWSDVEKYVEKINKVAISEIMGLHQKCKNILSTNTTLFKSVTAKIIQSAPKTRPLAQNSQISLF